MIDLITSKKILPAHIKYTHENNRGLTYGLGEATEISSYDALILLKQLDEDAIIKYRNHIVEVEKRKVLFFDQMIALKKDIPANKIDQEINELSQKIMSSTK